MERRTRAREMRGGLAGLFAGLLAGCVAPSGPERADESYGCDGGCGCTYDDADVLLTRAAYAQWIGEGAVTTGDDTSGTGDDTSGTGDDTSGTGDDTSGTGDDTSGTGDDTGSGGSSGDAGPIDAAALTPEICVALCEQEAQADDWELTCSVPELTPEDQVRITCTWSTGCDGRRHACLRSSGVGAEGDAVTSWLARVAHDEAGSVHAFVALGRELAEHGAPRALLRRVRRAAADERRHARVVDRLVRARGGRWRRPVAVACGRRGLLAIAIENAVEGCVRETWAALSAAHQGRAAADEDIRRAMVGIAGDERAHAELAWAIDGWLRSRLDDGAWAQVEAARGEAARGLRAGLSARRLDAAVVRAAGVADGAVARRLVDGLAAALWGAAD